VEEPLQNRIYGWKLGGCNDIIIYMRNTLFVLLAPIWLPLSLGVVVLFALSGIYVDPHSNSQYPFGNT